MLLFEGACQYITYTNGREFIIFRRDRFSTPASIIAESHWLWNTGNSLSASYAIFYLFTLLILAYYDFQTTSNSLSASSAASPYINFGGFCAVLRSNSSIAVYFILGHAVLYVIGSQLQLRSFLLPLTMTRKVCSSCNRSSISDIFLHAFSMHQYIYRTFQTFQGRVGSRGIIFSPN